MLTYEYVEDLKNRYKDIVDADPATLSSNHRDIRHMILAMQEQLDVMALTFQEEDRCEASKGGHEYKIARSFTKGGRTYMPLICKNCGYCSVGWKFTSN